LSLFTKLSSEWVRAGLSLLLLIACLAMDFFFKPHWFQGQLRFIFYLITYLPVGLPILIKGLKLALRGDLFTEFLLMSLATVGAFYIGEFPEGVAVMLFYAIGELFQGAAVSRAKNSIRSLLEIRPTIANVKAEGKMVSVSPGDVQIGDVIVVRAGERIPLDGVMLSDDANFNASALTGESRPLKINRGEQVLAGMINNSNVIEVRTNRLYNDSAISRIIALVQNAQGRKAKTELFIRKFARAYTPVVVFVAIALTLLPYFFVDEYVFNEWLYRALIFLVISCPCALVVAIPLGYFGGIGAASRNGILIKGSSYLDRLTRIDAVVFDKTGTLTKGVFNVQQVVSKALNEDEWLPLLAALESQSTHPIAKAIVTYMPATKNRKIENVEEIKGYGVKGRVDGREILAGNVKLLQKFNVPVNNNEVASTPDTTVVVAVDGKLAGYVTISDEIKEDAVHAVKQMHLRGIETLMLSGDKQSVVDQVASRLDIGQAFGDLLPEDKVEKFDEIRKEKSRTVAFVGDGINDAPVLAISDVGIAMGGLGSDAAIETADVVIQTDQPSKILTAITIGKVTNRIVWQNIGFAFTVKIIVMALGAWGVASMWEAVFADVGVALLAILNAVRIQRMKF
jgi:Zn2+/Cd2+-exporting ATPase